MASKEVRATLNGDESKTDASHLKRVAAINYLCNGEEVSYTSIDAQLGFEIKKI